MAVTGISKQKNIGINIGVFILALFIALQIYRNQEKALEQLRAKKEIEIKKNALLNDLSLYEKKIEAYKNLLYWKDASVVINNISQIAQNTGVKVVSVRPEGEVVEKYYGGVNLSIVVNAADYHSIGKFVNGLEKSDEVYLVDVFSIHKASGAYEKEDYLTAELKLKAVFYKEG